jgi:hypothetical protein
MLDNAIEKHQLAGFDDRDRGFSRPVECDPTTAGFRAVLRYETVRVVAEHPGSTVEALEELVQVLHGQGYRELRSQLSFRNGVYLGSQEPWIQYPDPAPEHEPTHGFWDKLRRWVQRTRRPVGAGP